MQTPELNLSRLRINQSSAIAGPRHTIVLDRKFRSLNKRAPGLHLVEVDFFPQLPPHIIHVQRICERHSQDSSLDIICARNVSLEEIHGLFAKASQQDALQIPVLDGAGRFGLDEARKFRVAQILQP
jgi:hypothetical protein